MAGVCGFGEEEQNVNFHTVEIWISRSFDSVLLSLHSAQDDREMHSE